MTDPTIQETAAPAPVDTVDGGPLTVEDADAAVVTAEQDAVEAESLAKTLEQQFLDGADDVDHDRIEKQRSLSRFAKMQVERARRRADRARTAKRLVEAEQIRAEIDGYSAGIGAQLAAALTAVADAEDAFLTLAADHDARVSGWTARAAKLGIPETDGRPVPPAADAGLALGKGATLLHAGRRSFTAIGGRAMLDNYRTKAGGAAPDGFEGAWKSDRTRLIESIAQTDAEAPEPNPNLRFFRGRGGAVIAMDRDMSDAERQQGLVEISRAEAWGE